MNVGAETFQGKQDACYCQLIHSQLSFLHNGICSASIGRHSASFPILLAYHRPIQ